MTAARRRSRKQRLFTLLVLFAGLYLVSSVLPRRRRRASLRPVAPPAGNPAAAPANLVDDLVASLDTAQAPALEPEAETLPFAVALAFDEPLDDIELPPVAAIAGGTYAPPARRRLRTGAKSVVITGLLALAVVALPTAALSDTSPPTIVSDQADYPAGSTVTLTGENWAADELVHIFVNDDVGNTWTYDADVTASSEGTLTHQFQLPPVLIALFRVTATGPISGTAPRRSPTLRHKPTSTSVGTGARHPLPTAARAARPVG